MNAREDASRANNSTVSEPLPAENTELAKGLDVNRAELTLNAAKERLGPYVPRDHRPLTSNLSSMGALVNLLKSSMGMGVLAMPLAFKNVGLVVGVVGTALVAFICTHAVHILVKTSQELCVVLKRPAVGYADTCGLVFQYGPKAVRRFAPYAREVADWALALTHFGACCVYVVVIGESFKQVSDEYGGPKWSLTVFCCLTLVPLLPLTQINKLEYLVPFSAIANFVWVTAVAVTMYYCFRDQHSIYERNLATSIKGMPNFISISLFAMEGIGIVMPIENEMRKPHEFLGCPGVLNIAMATMAVIYGAVGFAGYLEYGEEVRGNLTFNLPQHEVLAIMVKILVACVLILTFSLIYYVPFDVVWRRLQPRVSPGLQWLARSALRFAGTLTIVYVAATVPRLELFIGLVGAVCLSFIGLIFPAIAETVWCWDKDLGPYYYIVFKNITIVSVAMIAMVTGVTAQT